MLETTNKFNITSPNKCRPFSPDQFFLWSNRNHYRTSYNDMMSPTPVEKKNNAIPKYQGYVPGMTSNNEFGARYTQVTRKCFDKKKLDDAPNMFSSTGFNWTKIPKEDATLTASTHKFGKQTMQKPHPVIGNDKATTIFRESFKKPQLLASATMRHSQSQQVLGFDSKLKDSWKLTTFASGFQNNAQKGDGKGWIPEKVLHSDMVRTEYRNRFNQPKTFHHMTLRMSTGKLPMRALVYDKE